MHLPKDIDWFITFLPVFSGKTKNFKNEIRNSSTLHIDACLTGVGGIWNNRVYAAPVPQYENFQPKYNPLGDDQCPNIPKTLGQMVGLFSCSD